MASIGSNELYKYPLKYYGIKTTFGDIRQWKTAFNLFATGSPQASNKNPIFLEFPESPLGRNNLNKLCKLIYSAALPLAIQLLIPTAIGK